MAYYTATDLRTAAGLTASASSAALRREAKSVAGRFDIFLSHSMKDAQLIYGLRNLLAAGGFSVYVDWIDDPQLDRSKVSASTAARLRLRMKQSSTLVYATSRAARRSRWMPWELGYFDALRNGERISIVPIEDHGTGAFDGEEYLGLYKHLEKIYEGETLRPYVVSQSVRRGEPLRSFVNGERRYTPLVPR